MTLYRALNFTIYWFFRFLDFCLLVRVILSWLPVDKNRGIPGLIHSITEPVLAPIRNMLAKSPLGSGMMIDFSPFIAMLLIQVLQQLLGSLLYSIFVRGGF